MVTVDVVSLVFPRVVVGICCKMVVVGVSGVPVVMKAADWKINIILLIGKILKI